MKHALLVGLVTTMLGVAGSAYARNYHGEWTAGCCPCVCPYPMGYYYNATWGTPVALVVPPTAEKQTHWGWGVGNTRVTTIYSQFGGYWGSGYYGPVRPTPVWPTDTDQLGVYPVRGPW
jgi:hypothetical protein